MCVMTRSIWIRGKDAAARLATQLAGAFMLGMAIIAPPSFAPGPSASEIPVLAELAQTPDLLDRTRKGGKITPGSDLKLGRTTAPAPSHIPLGCDPAFSSRSLPGVIFPPL